MATAVDETGPLPVESAVNLPTGGVLLLVRLRLALLRNRIRQAVREQPLKIVGIVASVLLIWIALYRLLLETFGLVRQQMLEGIVAAPLIFTFFFLTLTVMLAFSNAILCYGNLFKRPESAYLLASPLDPRDMVIVKYVESLVLSSWSLLLLGLPLMMAMARTFHEPWTFYPLFLSLFLLFIPLPGALGLLLAWFVVMVCPKTPRRAMVAPVVILAAAGAWWFRQSITGPATSSQWLDNFYDRAALVQNAMFPHTWVSKGISYAVQDQSSTALFYLFVTLANALFASVVAVGVVSYAFVPAFARAQTSGARGVRRSGIMLAWIAEILFAYLPRRQRLLAAKDLKSFFRDPLQWTQMAILFGLLAVYVVNVQRLWTAMAHPQLQLLIAFLNLTAVSLILATFTSRFVFPLVSLEGQQLWLLGLLALPRSRLIIAKFLYASTITLLTALLVMGASVIRLDLSPPLALAHLLAISAMCVGLCGISVGMGARMPVFHERNPARIAGGFGGTISLLISVGLVAASLTGMGILSFRAIEAGYGDTLSISMATWLIAVIALNAAAAAIALALGIRHFNRVQC